MKFKSISFWAAIIVMAITVSLMAFTGWDAGPSLSSVASASPSQTRRQGTVELLTLKPTGFDPAQITVPHKSFLLVIENRSGVNELFFRFDKEVGPKLQEIRVPLKRTSWSGIVDLPPSTYKMTEASHPEWSCTLTITPN